MLMMLKNLNSSYSNGLVPNAIIEIAFCAMRATYDKIMLVLFILTE